MRILLAGHWEPPATDPSYGEGFGEHSASAVLKSVEAGIRGVAEAAGADESLTFDLLPFGPGPAFTEALAQQSAKRLLFLDHSEQHDWGLAELADLIGVREISLDLPEEVLSEHLLEARGRALPRVVAAGTTRSLLGPGGTAFLTPSLDPRTEVASPGQVEKWRGVLKESWAQTQERGGSLLPLAGAIPETDPTLIEGSGAGGGLAALYLALGGTVLPAWQVLAEETSLGRRIEEADLVIFVQPVLDAPGLADTPLGLVASVAQGSATPVVAVADRSSLSGPERADLGIHGVSTLRPFVSVAAGDPFQDCGRRLGQTWLPR